MPSLIAKERFPYGGRHLEAGERFEESEKYAEILTALGKAEYVGRDIVHVEPATLDESSSLTDRPPARRAAPKYRRRDLRCED